MNAESLSETFEVPFDPNKPKFTKRTRLSIYWRSHHSSQRSGRFRYECKVL